QRSAGLEARECAVVRALRAGARARAEGRLLARAARADRLRRRPAESAAPRADVRHVADRLLPVLPHRPLARAARELAVREERARHLAEARRDPDRRAGDQRTAGDAAGGAEAPS